MWYVWTDGWVVTSLGNMDPSFEALGIKCTKRTVREGEGEPLGASGFKEKWDETECLRRVVMNETYTGELVTSY